MRLALIGYVLGLPLALWVASIAEKQKMLPKDAVTYAPLAAAIGVLVLSTLAAALAPAIRASLVNPIQALRRG